MATYTTWNPSDKSSAITLSGSDLIATHSGADGWVSCRSVLGVSAGKWYWEVTATAISPSGLFVGVANSSATLAGFIGSDANGWGYHAATGNFFHSGDTGVPGVTWTTSQVMGIALDMDSGTVKFYKNNTQSGSTVTGLSGTIYAGVSTITVNSGGGSLTANFGATALTYSPPSGYNAGLYEEGGATFRRKALLGVGQ